MTLDVGRALRDGVDRTVRRAGPTLVLAFLLVGLASAAVTQTVTVGLLELAPADATDGSPAPLFGGAGSAPAPLALPVPLGVAVALWLALAVVHEALRVVAVRVLVGEEPERVTGAAVRRDLGPATANSLVGNFVATALVLVGFLLLVVPGVFLALSFLFVRQEVAVEGEGFVDAMVGSWTLAAGDRVELFALALVVVGVELLAWLSAAAFGLAGATAMAVAGAVTGAVAAVFGVAVVSRAYAQLRAEREADVGALGPDDIEEPA